MKYYCYLNLNFKPIVEKITPYVLENFAKEKNFFVSLDENNFLKLFPDLHKIFIPMEIEIDKIALIIHNSHWHDFIHIDDYPDPDDPNPDTLRINFPLINCEKSRTNFYELKPGKFIKTDETGIYSKVYRADPEDCVLVDGFCLNKPVVLRTEVLHNVVLDPGVTQRISLTMKFKQDLGFLLL
jgi:hypothetical protein